jgi:predicted RND superfamily exporter protein
MAEKLDPNKELTTWQEISYSNMIEQQALLSLLFEKNIITREEYMDRIKLVHKEIQGKAG